MGTNRYLVLLHLDRQTSGLYRAIRKYGIAMQHNRPSGVLDSNQMECHSNFRPLSCLLLTPHTKGGVASRKCTT
jgi:hypothetical protein